MVCGMLIFSKSYTVETETPPCLFFVYFIIRLTKAKKLVFLATAFSNKPLANLLYHFFALKSTVYLYVTTGC